MSKMFYVYELRDDRGCVFYVGKGSGYRLTQHRHRAHADTTHRANKIRKLWQLGRDYIAVKVFETTDEEAAFREEKRLIKLYGRNNLTNKTDGGDGPANMAEDARQRISAAMKARTVSPETRARQRQAKLGRPRTPETRAKIAAYRRGKKHPWARSLAMKNLEAMKGYWKGKKHKPSTIEKMKISKTGHEVTAATRKKISDTKKGSIPWNKGKKLITH